MRTGAESDVRPPWRVILGVAASDAHVVANRLIERDLRQKGYDVVNLGACTSVEEFAACHAANPDALAVAIGSLNGHALTDLATLPRHRARGLLRCPVIVGGNLSVGMTKQPSDIAALMALGVDHVLSEPSELIALLAVLAAERTFPAYVQAGEPRNRIP